MNVEQQEPMYIADRNVEMVQPLWKSVWWALKKLNIQLPFHLAIGTLYYISKEWKAGTK